MTSSGSGSGSGDHRSPAPPRAVVDGLLDVRARAEMLQTMFDGSPTPPRAAGKELVEGMMSSVTSALSALSTGGGGGTSSSSTRSGGARRKKGAAVAGPIRRTSSSSCRRRTLSPFLETVTTEKLDDGHAWRKYGSKHIQDSVNPRSYYRCTHMPDQGCKARKQVQVSDTNPSEYIVSYFGKHTCRDLSTIPFVIQAATDVPPTNCANFICFGSATTSSGAHAASAVPRLSRFAGYSTSLPAVVEQQRCGSEEAISSSSRAAGHLGAVVGSTTVGSAPDEYRWPPDGEASGIGTGSFPSSPSSLGGFMQPGSFGSFGTGMDDDWFGFGFDP